MKRLSFILLLIVFALSGFAEDLWFKPLIKSRVYESALQEDAPVSKKTWEEYLPISPYSSSESPQIKLNRRDKVFRTPLDSRKIFVHSLRNYFTARQDSSMFLCYQPLSGFGELQVRILGGTEYMTGDTSEKEQSTSFVYYGGEVRMDCSSNFYLYARWWGGHHNEYLDYAEANSLHLDSFYKRRDTSINIDNIEGYAAWHNRLLGTVSLGRGKWTVGNSISGNVILNDACNEYGYFAWKYNLGSLTLGMLNAVLIADSTNTDYSYKNYEEKGLALHRIGWHFSSTNEIFVGEEIIYNGRILDPSYLMPHAFLRIAEHNLRDRDNVLIFAGWQVELKQHWLSYGNIAFDELKKSELFGNWWGNKWAVQTGFGFHTSMMGDDFRIIGEFTAIRPWLYTHKALPNKFSHDGMPLGYPKGSNLIDYTLEVNVPLGLGFILNSQGSYTRQGSVGNHFSINYETRPSENARWLDGEITDTARARIMLDWRMLAHHTVKLGLQHVEIIDGESNTNLYLGWHTEY
ncbi:MAG: hypothetical protein K8S56_06765 [Candidatus Cloacimonetes bacterium]|nr:hypothetical protein [Candidatus Cloacimonadota bacterium]